MPQPRRDLTFRVRFNELRFNDDLQHARAAGRAIGLQARALLERDGVAQNLLASCEDDHRDGTNLAGTVKLYLPMPYGDWGLVLQGAEDTAGLHLLAPRTRRRATPAATRARRIGLAYERTFLLHYYRTASPRQLREREPVLADAHAYPHLVATEWVTLWFVATWQRYPPCGTDARSSFSTKRAFDLRAFPVRLTGACSNPQLDSRLRAAARAHAAALSLNGELAAPVVALRPPMGAIQAAVLDVLGQCAALRPREIQLRVEQRLGQPTSYDTVASFLSVAARDASSAITRSGRGRYCLLANNSQRASESS